MEQDLFEKAYVNALLYGTSIILMQFDGAKVSVRVIPFNEYKELGQALTEFPERVDMEDKK
jgi:hypothetical protein